MPEEDVQNVVQANKRFSYIVWAIALFGIIAVISATLVAIFAPGVQTLIIIGSVFSFVTATTAALLMALREVSTQVGVVHQQINSRMDELVAATRLAGIAEGRKDEKAEQRAEEQGG